MSPSRKRAAVGELQGEVRGLRAKGVQGVGSAAQQSALRAAAARRRGGTGEADVGGGSSAAAVRLSADRPAAWPPKAGMPGRRARVAAVASGGPESAAETAKTQALGQSDQGCATASRRAQRPRVVLGLRVRPHDERQPAEVAVDRGRAHAGVPGVEGGREHHERGRDRHAGRAVRHAWRAQAIRSDNGPEFVAAAIRRWLGQVDVETLYIEPGSPWENGYAESFHSRLRDEFWRPRCSRAWRQPGG